MKSKFIALVLLIAVCIATAIQCPVSNAQQPNVILLMTDDQGLGDLGFTGNPVIETPHLDALAKESVWLKQFYVSPVCAPTRASMMTGRYNYRTRVVDTYIGRAMMDPDEITVAEILKEAGYATGIFGKWHLGDNYPTRPMDQGFDVSVVHRGGGIGQPSDPLQAQGKYTDPILMANGVEKQFTGYCSNVYFDQAIKFLRESKDAGKPFFIYLPDNCPHGPWHDVPEAWYEKYKAMDLSNDLFPSTGNGLREVGKLDNRARNYAMISNFDEQVGRLMKELDDQGIADNTIVIFLTDNGPNRPRYNAGLRRSKSSVYEGGIRAPFIMRWPSKIKPGEMEQVAAHIDLLPTLAEACDAKLPSDRKIDGRSFLDLVTGASDEWSERSICIQGHRGDVPKRDHHFMIRRGDWKLVHASGYGGETPEEFNFELYNLRDDPYEQKDLAGTEPEKVKSLTREYSRWFDDVSSTRTDNFDPVRIVIDPTHEPMSTLTRQDWRRRADRMEPASWGKQAGGQWLIHVASKGKYTFKCHFNRNHLKEPNVGDNCELHIGGVAVHENKIVDGTAVFTDVLLEQGDTEICANTANGKAELDVWQIEITKED